MSPLFLGEGEYSRRSFFKHSLSSVSSKSPWISPGERWLRRGLRRIYEEVRAPAFPPQFLEAQCTIEMMPQHLCCGQGSSPSSEHIAQGLYMAFRDQNSFET